MLPVTIGASLSILNWRWKATLEVPSVAEQSSESELERKVLTTGQFVSVALATWICAVTSLTYQPLLPAVPELTV